MNIYWGDLHNHCGITYGLGGLENALKIAQSHLDFCCITGHAMWPDIPEGTNEELKFLVSFHERGFEKLRKNWEHIRETINKANVENKFTTFQGYEIHSRQYGDYHIVSPAEDLPLLEADTPAHLVEKLNPRPVIAVPHHVGYTPGYRGCNWNDFSSNISPIVEVYSKHGCGMSEESLYPYLHTMGPRDPRSVVYEGLRKGHRFGFAGSTDHHAGYPGSYGDGKIAVLANGNTRADIWEGILARRTYAVTGDKIKCDFQINNTMLGGKLKGAKERNISLKVEACDTIDKIIVYKNLRPWKIINGEIYDSQVEKAKTFKVRIEMGWGKNVTGYDWNGAIEAIGGNIISVESCFRGRSVLAPTKGMEIDDDINLFDNKVIQIDDRQVQWKCNTVKNPTTLHSMTNAIIIEVAGDSKTQLKLNVNNTKRILTMDQLAKAGETFHIQAYNSEAVMIHRAVTDNQYKLFYEWIDEEVESFCDMYHVEIRQKNNQCAWISPIFVEN